MKDTTAKKMREDMYAEYYLSEISNHITYETWLEDKLIQSGYKMKVANEDVSHKKYGICQSVTLRILGVILFIPASMIYFLLYLIANPMQYIATGEHTIAGKFHKFIDRCIKLYGM